MSVLILPSVSSIAFAQYMPPQGVTGLDDYLKLSKDRVRLANENPHTSSGTLMFALDGVLGLCFISRYVWRICQQRFLLKDARENTLQWEGIKLLLSLYRLKRDVFHGNS